MERLEINWSEFIRNAIRNTPTPIRRKLVEEGEEVEPSQRGEEKLGAIKALYLLASKIPSDCLIIAGDNLFTFSLKPMVEKNRTLRALLIAFLRKSPLTPKVV